MLRMTLLRLPPQNHNLSSILKRYKSTHKLSFRPKGEILSVVKWLYWIVIDFKLKNISH